MKNKKFLIIGIIVIIVLAIIIEVGVSKSKLEDNLFNQDGTVVDGHKDLINHLKSIEDKEERKKQVDFSLQQNIITQEEADILY